MKRLTIVTLMALLVPLFLVACGATPASTQAPAATAAQVVTAAPPTTAPAASTKVPPTATAVPPTPTKAPAVGGTLVYALPTEPESLHPHVMNTGAAAVIGSLLGASLVAISPTGEYVPYAAESWKVSADGLVWDFALKKNVKFHDGTPCTAKDWAWTFDLAKSASTNSNQANLAPVSAFEATGDYTLRMTLKQPYFPLLVNLTDAARLTAIPRAAVEKLGDQFGRQPLGIGPFKFKEWKTGAKVVVERNPDFSWGPAYGHQGAPYIQYFEVRIIPESATILAGLEAGELDNCAAIPAKDVDRFRSTGRFQIFQAVQTGNWPYLVMNVTRPLFQDVRVRQAFNMAVDRQTLIKVYVQGAGVEMRGPISSSVAGYWPEIEKLGYGYDPDRAKALMQEAGYTAGADGTLAKDGKPLKLTIKVRDSMTPLAEVLKEQFKAVGVELEIQALEFGSLIKDTVGGNYDLSLLGIVNPEVDMLNMLFHSSSIGAMNIGQISDPQLDKLLEATRTTVEPKARQDAVNTTLKYIIEKAYMCPLYAPITFVPLSNRVKGAVWSNRAVLYLEDAYIESK